MPIKDLHWATHIHEKVRIYRNLNNGRMSIQAKVRESWKVVGHVQNAILQDVQFRISEAGRQRVIRDGCKNVHAWGEGILLAEFDTSINAAIDLTYNPYLNATFIQRDTDIPIMQCRFLVVRSNRVYVTPDAIGDIGSRPVLTVHRGGVPSRQLSTQLKLDLNAMAA
jgi:hypothetical protein